MKISITLKTEIDSIKAEYTLSEETSVDENTVQTDDIDAVYSRLFSKMNEWLEAIRKQ